jgi:hypothetical protein
VGYINDGANCTSASRANTTPSCISYIPNTAAAQTLMSLDPLGILMPMTWELETV